MKMNSQNIESINLHIIISDLRVGIMASLHNVTQVKLIYY